MSENLVEVKDLRVKFVTRDRTVNAVNGVDFTLQRGEVLTILGESGSGKSVMLRSLMRLHPPKRTQISGSIRVAGQDVVAMEEEALSAMRGRTVSMIFQEPMLAFDPVFTIGRQIAESVIHHEKVGETVAMARALEMLERVQIPSAKRRLAAYPHEMSGGMRQRAMIALALACKPTLLLADEPTTALDATVQIQILLLLRKLQKELGMAMIFVTHDVGVAVEIADRIAVMYAGRFIETGPVAGIIRTPQHPYTTGLLHSTVHGSMRGQRLEAIPGAPPDLSVLPPGCAFAPRCRHVQSACRGDVPAPVAIAPDHAASCIRVAAA